MALPEHLFDQMIASLPRPVLGTVKGVHHGTDRQPLTTYDVEIYPQTAGYTATVNLNRVPYRGQQAGGAIEQSNPLLVGQKVAVEFAEGDYNRPHIEGVWGDKTTTLRTDSSTYPQPTWSINGVVILIDKDGNVSIQLPENKTLTIKDKDGNRVTKVSEDGSVELGDGTMKRLLNEAAVSILQAHIHADPATGFTGPALTPPSTPMDLSGALTAKTQAS